MTFLFIHGLNLSFYLQPFRGSNGLGQLPHRSQVKTPSENLVLGQIIADQQIVQVDFYAGTQNIGQND